MRVQQYVALCKAAENMVLDTPVSVSGLDSDPTLVVCGSAYVTVCNVVMLPSHDTVL